MNKEENRQRVKNEALNKILKIYHPKYNFPYDRYDESSCAEQREYFISNVIEELNRKLEEIKKP